MRQLGFDARFMRIWEFYLAYCEAAFATGNTDVMQFTLQQGLKRHVDAWPADRQAVLLALARRAPRCALSPARASHAAAMPGQQLSRAPRPRRLRQLRYWRRACMSGSRPVGLRRGLWRDAELQRDAAALALELRLRRAT